MNSFESKTFFEYVTDSPFSSLAAGTLTFSPLSSFLTKAMCRANFILTLANSSVLSRTQVAVGRYSLPTSLVPFSLLNESGKKPIGTALEGRNVIARSDAYLISRLACRCTRHRAGERQLGHLHWARRPPVSPSWPRASRSSGTPYRLSAPHRCQQCHRHGCRRQEPAP